MRLALMLLLLALAAPVAAEPPKYASPRPWLSFDRVSTHLLVREYWETQESRTFLVACEQHRNPAWELPDTKFGAAVNYELHRLWNLEGSALHSTRTGKEEVALTLRICLPLLSAKQYR